MEEGWIKIHRKILDWEWYKDDNTFKVFMYLLLSANYKDGRWKGVEVKRGQLITGRVSIAENTGISERATRTCLNHLKATGEITIKTTNRYSMVTITKYEDYQIKESHCDQQSDQQLVTQATSNRPATDHKQEYKEVKNKEKENLFSENSQEGLSYNEIDFSKIERYEDPRLKELFKGEEEEIVPKGF